MQFNKSQSLIDNLYSLLSIASVKFNQEKFDYLIEQIKSTWSDETFKSHDKLLLLFRMIEKCLDQVKLKPGLNLNSMYCQRYKSWSTSKTLNDVLSDIVVPEIKVF
jgi:hypothetical protein